MQLVIDIHEKDYQAIKNGHIPFSVLDVIMKGTQLPKGHGRLIDADEFLEKVKKDREHEIYLHSWTADMVLKRLDSWYAPTIIDADKESEEQ